MPSCIRAFSPTISALNTLRPDDRLAPAQASVAAADFVPQPRAEAVLLQRAAAVLLPPRGLLRSSNPSQVPSLTACRHEMNNLCMSHVACRMSHVARAY